MLAQVKTAVDRTKKFVKDHPTLSACAATAVVSWKLSHDITLKGVLDETTELAYAWGAHAGALEAYLLATLDFVDTKGLNEELAEFAIKQNG